LAGAIGKLASRAGTRKRSKVPLPPSELVKFFSEPPLVGLENKEDFYKLFSAIAAAIKPPDAIAWLFTWDVTCLSWEIKRERAVKAEIIQSAVGRAAARFLGLIEALGQQYDGENYTEIRRFTSEDSAKLADNGYTPSDMLAEAYILGAADIDAIDRRIASYEARRMAVMRAVEAYNEKFARKLEDARDIVDAEYTDLPTKKT
jgi:hypothetical protein